MCYLKMPMFSSPFLPLTHMNVWSCSGVHDARLDKTIPSLVQSEFSFIAIRDFHSRWFGLRHPKLFARCTFVRMLINIVCMRDATLQSHGSEFVALHYHIDGVLMRSHISSAVKKWRNGEIGLFECINEHQIMCGGRTEMSHANYSCWAVLLISLNGIWSSVCSPTEKLRLWLSHCEWDEWLI